MKILIVGGGGREHAIAKKLTESPKVSKLYAAPGNGGIASIATCVDIAATDIPQIVSFAVNKKIDFVVVAPDDPLVLGMVDILAEKGIPAFGPSMAAARIEGSKVFSKNLMKKYNIPTAQYEVFNNASDAKVYIEKNTSYPIVIKADGLALGKGVVIPENKEDALGFISEIMESKVFGESGSRVVIEEFMTGPEVSVLAFVDGETVVPMISAMDHKRIFDGNKGPNTGGMGTIAPNPHYTQNLADICMKTIFEPTVRAMRSEGSPFKGCLFFGLMITPNGPKVIEYNCRFGDPETQVVLPLLKTDLLEIMEATVNGTLDKVNIQWEDKACACVIAASGGYPEAYDKGYPISGLDLSGGISGATVYHAGTKKADDKFLTNGGRVLGLATKGNSLDEALDKAYTVITKIKFEGMQYRKDIGKY